MKKTHFRLIPTVLLLCLTISQTVLAENTTYVTDNAGLFSEDEIDAIADKIAELQSETDMDYLVVTTDDAEGKSAQEYADDTYEASGAGTGDNYSGMLYLIDMDNREIYISTEGDIIRYLTDERIESILDHAFNDVADGYYGDSALTVLEDVGKYIAEGIVSDQHNYDSETGESDYYYEEESGGFPILSLLFGMIVGLIAALIKYFGVKGDYQLTSNTYEYPLSEKSSLDLNVTEDRLVNKFVTHRRIPKNPPSSGRSSGRSTVHRSSSGRTHGGGGRKF